MKVMLRIPIGRDNPHYLLTEWLVWLARQTDIDIGFFKCTDGPAYARNDIVTQDFLPSDCTHLWMVDSDVVPPKRLDLLKTDEDVICGWYDQYNTRFKPYPLPVVYIKHPTKEGVTFFRKKNWPEGDIFHADACGTGCMLIKRRILEEKAPYVFGYGQTDGRRIGEDITFCRSIGGVKVMRDYECKHFRELDLQQLRYTAEMLKHGIG